MPNQNNTWDWFRNDKLNLTIISDKVNQVTTKIKQRGAAGIKVCGLRYACMLAVGSVQRKSFLQLAIWAR